MECHVSIKKAHSPKTHRKRQTTSGVWYVDYFSQCQGYKLVDQQYASLKYIKVYSFFKRANTFKPTSRIYPCNSAQHP